MAQRTRCGWYHTSGLFWCAALGAAVLSGCGEAAPNRYHLKGTVNFAGAPLPYGAMHIDPDAGNTGPQSYVEIIDGKFDTRANKGLGVIPGKVVVKVVGFKTKPGAARNSDEPIPALFEEYVKKLDLPKKESVENFEIPQEAVGTKRNRAAVYNGP